MHCRATTFSGAKFELNAPESLINKAQAAMNLMYAFAMERDLGLVRAKVLCTAVSGSDQLSLKSLAGSGRTWRRCM